MEFIPVDIDLALFTLRLAVGVLFLAHGPVKLFNTQEIARKLSSSPYTVITLGLAETIGALSLILGVGTRFGAVSLMITMLCAIYYKTRKWETTFTGNNGWQLEFILLAAALTIFLSGSGNLTIF